MALIVGSPKFQAFDVNGDPLSGGKLYSYIGGSTTPKSTYPTLADALAGTNANTNPVILDSRGEANIVVSGDTKLILTTATGSVDSPIWSFDHIDVSSNDITDGNGNEILTFSPVTNAVNNFNMSNSVSGSPPILSVVGTDSNIGLRINVKGSGAITLAAPTAVSGATTITGTLDVSGATNITNTLTATGVATLSGGAVLNSLTYPTVDGTAAGFAIKTDGAGVLSFGGKISTVVHRVFTSSTTYTPTTGTLVAHIFAVGGGGGGAGCSSTSTTAGIGGGGGAGGMAVLTATIAQIGASATVTIGAGGSAGSSGNAGSAGGNTSIALTGTGTLSIVGGAGSGGSTAGNQGAGGNTSGGAGGSITSSESDGITGQPGRGGFCPMGGASVPMAVGGDGGSPGRGFGIGGRGGIASNGGGGPASTTGTGFGAGGGGAATAGAVGAAGSNGTAGLVYIIEYVCT